MTSTLTGAFTVAVHRSDQDGVRALRPTIDAAAAALRVGEDPLCAVECALTQTDVETRALQRLDASDQTCLFSDEVLFPPDVIRNLTIAAPGVPAFRTDPAAIPVVSDYLQCAVSGEFSEGDLADAQPALTQFFASAGCLGERVAPIARPREVGVFRMQHAGLLYQSSTSRILVDPHFHSAYAARLSTVFGAREFASDVDAVLISHSHSDHLSLGSLLFLPRDTLIVVPYVARASLLCPDMVGLLTNLGFTNVRAPRWYGEAILVGDIEVFALPFYGEQPLASEAWPDAAVRNWGNTYYIRAPEFTSFVLIDSGNDTRGGMLRVAEYVRDELGPVDYLLSNLGEFCVGANGPRYIASNGSYFLTLSRAQMRRFASLQGESLTLGPQGVAECCRACDARYFLPYAHWWGEPYVQTKQERHLLPKLARALRARGNATTIVPWHIGERVAGRADDAVYIPGPLFSERTVPIADFSKVS